MRVDVGDEAEVAPVARLEEDGHEGDEAEQDRQLAGVQHPDGDEEGAGQHAADDDPDLLRPEAAARHPVQVVRDEAAERPRHEVLEAEDRGHVGDVRGAGVGGVLQVVGAEDGIYGELAAEGAQVRDEVEDGLRRREDRYRAGECGLFDDLAFGNFHHLPLGYDRFVVINGVVLSLLFCLRMDTGILLYYSVSWCINNGAGRLCDTVGYEVLFGVEKSLGPFTGWRIGTKDEHEDAG